MKITAPEECRTHRGNLKYLSELRILSRKNRNNPTQAEKKMWDVLLKRNKTGFSFLRQKPLGKYILDFYCSKLMLAIEIDGSSHNNKSYLDRERDIYLKDRGIITIRFNNNQILKEIENVDKTLIEIIMKRLSEMK